MTCNFPGAQALPQLPQNAAELNSHSNHVDEFYHTHVTCWRGPAQEHWSPLHVLTNKGAINNIQSITFMPEWSLSGTASVHSMFLNMSEKFSQIAQNDSISGRICLRVKEKSLLYGLGYVETCETNILMSMYVSTHGKILSLRSYRFSPHRNDLLLHKYSSVHINLYAVHHVI